MKNRLDNNMGQDGIDNNSMNEMSDKEIASKFDKQMDFLKEIAMKEAKDKLEDGETTEEIDEQINKFFEKIDQDFDKINTVKEIRTKIKYNRISNRSIDVQKAIKQSGESILDEVLNWKKEKNVVAKSLFRIANWILKSEKNKNENEK